MKELTLNGLNEKIYFHKTKEGLPIYMWVNEKVTSTFMTLSVKYGSIHTKFKIKNKVYEVPNGTAHFLEHLKFNINKDVTAHDEFYKIGGDANAFTTFNYTSYVVFSTKEKMKNLNLLLDFVYNPYFTKGLVSKEKGIIVEEANMGADDAYTVSYFDSLKSVFTNSKYRNLITGAPSEIKSISLDDIKLIYNTFYHPRNMFLCITGNFNPYEVIKEVEDNLSKKEFLDYKSPEVIVEEEPKKVNTKYLEEYLNLTYPRIRVNLKIERSKFKNIDDFKLKILLGLILNINMGSTSDFKDDLISKGLATSIYTGIDFVDNYILISVIANTNYKDNVIELICEKLKKLEVNEKDLKRKKNASIATLILDYEDVEAVNSKIQDELINYNELKLDYKDILESITIDDLKKVVDKITLENMAINVFLPKENQED